MQIKQIVMGVLTTTVLCAAEGNDGPHCLEADRVMHEFAERMQQEKGLRLTGFGGEMSHEIQTFGLSFCVQHPLSLDAARVLYLEVLREFVTAVNQDRQIRPYLADYPLNPRHVEITLSLQDDSGKMRRDGSVCMIFNLPEMNRIQYNRFALDRIISSGEESMEEALATLEPASTEE
jgi:hypothetical protein